MLPGWTVSTIAGKPVDILAPKSASRFALLFLHPVGLESPAVNSAYTTALQNAGLFCVAPHGSQSWWSDRICPDFDPALTAEKFLLDSVVPWMMREWSLDDRSIAVAGISMGGQGAIRLGFKYPDRFPVVAGVASAFDYHEWHGRGTPIDAMYRSKEACRQDTAILQVHPSKFPPHIWFCCDPLDHEWYRGNDRLHEKLNAVGIPHTVDFTTSHGGHNWAYFNAMAEPMAQFCRTSLEREARRLL
ncbi:MAG: alpha/beta hydrolase-fold protein [Gemmataceae bacterium]